METKIRLQLRVVVILFFLFYLITGSALFAQDRILNFEPENNNNSSGNTAYSLAFKPEQFQKWGKINYPDEDLDLNYKPWETEKHFGIAVGELAIVEFIPWALARWIREWEDPSKNWAVVGTNTWWRNINNGWEYDGDNFVTNFFAHPYHGNLFFNTGRTNGYNFWESTAFAFTGSAAWEYFGETYRPAFNDWINTSINGINLGELTYRLSTMITDNTASGSERLWSEIFGTLINPVRGFNRLVSGEMNKSFPNPEWRKPEDFNIFLSSGLRRLDKNGSELVKDGVEEGIFGLDLIYGNPLKAVEPFSNFRISMVIASGLPRLNKLESSGYLAGFTLKNSETVKHKLDLNLEYGYYNIYKQDTEDSLKYEGILLGATSVYPHLLSFYKIWENSAIITEIGINGVLMGATPDDYYFDVEGRNYDFGPGIGMRLVTILNSGIWNYIKLAYNGIWIWTMSEPAESTHHIHNLSLELQFPLNNYFAFGIAGNVYWRNSYYTNFEDVYKEHPAVKIFFTTALL